MLTVCLRCLRCCQLTFLKESHDPSCTMQVSKNSPDHKKGSKATAKYGKLSEFMRHAVPEQQVCKMFCGGKNCKYCSVGHWQEENMAIKGLYSSWVTDNILATARPTKEAVEKYDAIKQFNQYGIKSIINLQTPGEHAYCGNALHESGFSYNPQEFMDNDVFFYNFGWPDYNVGSLQTLLDMTKVMDFALSQGKIAVHCHAGLGRTGVLIAAYLIYAHRMDPHDAIHFVRAKRPGAIQTRIQISCLEEFSSYLKPLRIVYSDVGPGREFTLRQFLFRQQKILHGFEARELKHLPKIVYVTCERLLQLAKKGRSLSRHSNNFEIVRRTSPYAFNNIPSEMEENDSEMGREKTGPMPSKSRSMSNVASKGRRSKEEDVDDEVTEEEREMLHPSVVKGATSDAEWVAECMASVREEGQEISREVKEKVVQHKTKLNNDDGHFDVIGKESDPCVLAALLFDWLDALKEPVLGSQDLPYMLMNYMNDPLKGLKRLSQGGRVTTEYLMGVLVRFSPIADKILQDLLQKLLSALTHRYIDVSSLDVTVSTQGSLSSLRGSQVMNRSQVVSVIRYFAVLLDQIKDKMDKEKEEKE